MSVPIHTPPGRSGFGPDLSITYSSGAGNGIFGLGWGLPLFIAIIVKFLSLRYGKLYSW